MLQDQKSGAAAVRYGLERAGKIARSLGAKKPGGSRSKGGGIDSSVAPMLSW